MSDYKYTVFTRCFTYNHASFIEDALQGFSMQELSFPVVYVIVDDASTDGEDKVLQNWTNNNLLLEEEGVAKNQQMPYGHLFFARHKDNPYAYFAIILLSENHYRIHKDKTPYFLEWLDNSKYTALCEGDDFWIDTHKLQRQVDIMETDSELSFVHTDCNILYQETGEVTKSANSLNEDVLLKATQNELIENILTAKCKIRTASVLYRNAVFNRFMEKNEYAYTSGYFMMLDVQRWIGLLQLGKSYYIPEAMVVYRLSVGTASRPQKYYDYVRFQISSKELRIYYNKHYGYLQKEIPSIIEEYKHLLRIYREHDPCFVGIIDIDKLYDNKIQHFLFRLKNCRWYINYNLQRFKTKILK